MNARTVRYDASDLSPTMNMAGRMMGYEGSVPSGPVLDALVEVFSGISDLSDIRGGYVMVDGMTTGPDGSSITVGNHVFKTGKIIARGLEGAEQAVLFLLTSGERFGALSGQEMKNGNLLKGYVIDVVGSLLVELAADRLAEDLKNKCARSGLGISNRYSPGYCGWPVADQEKLFAFFPEGFEGISLSERFMMHPIKSVSGLTGIGKKVVKREYQCKMCDDENCIYRKKYLA